MDIVGVKKYIMSRLENEQPASYYYHNSFHTLDVYNACIRLAIMENVTPSDRLLIETAALFHDAGILLNYVDHEESSLKIAREVLPAFGYESEHIEKIGEMILCTKLPQIECCLNSKILCDADMDYLGRSDFFMIAHKLRCEWAEMNNHFGLLEWYKFQLKFLMNHSYFTHSAIAQREGGKQANIAELRRLLGME